MALLGIDLGGTKLAIAAFKNDGEIFHHQYVLLEGRQGDAVEQLLASEIINMIDFASSKQDPIQSIGICIPGIYHKKSGTVWAPNIPGWSDFPLLEKIKAITDKIPVTIDSDRACYVLGEHWKGNAQRCKDVIFLSVGTGIGAGILIEGNVLRGTHDIAGAIGWMALNRPYKDEYVQCGCFENYASGEGISKLANFFLQQFTEYSGALKNKGRGEITSHDIFTAYEKRDLLAIKVIDHCVESWGMAVANLVSLFNPEKIILGGGVFGPAIKLIPKIEDEAKKWAQPISIKQVKIEASALGGDAGIYGAGFLALQNI